MYFFPSDSTLNILEYDSTREIDGRKDRHEEEGSNPPKTMDDSVVDHIVDGEQKLDIQKTINLSPGDF